jgi:O-acetyl-ADP-ribose deacetylase (regulator of RNase III)
MEVDAIVNSAGTRQSRVGGVEGSILDIGGPLLRKEQFDFGELMVGQAKYTSAPNLYANYVIHVSGPVYDESKNNEIDLRNSYQNALKLAVDLDVESIAFPLISSGSYGYPKKRALVIAQEEILRFLEYHEMMIYLVVFDKSSFTISKDFQKDIKQYIRTGYVVKRHDRVANMQADREMLRAPMQRSKSTKTDSIDDMVLDVEAGFTDTLLKLIDKTGQTDSYIYKKANIDRKLFSKIRNNRYYRPSKNTILAFAIALELSLNKTNDLLSRAGYVLSKSILFDVIIIECLMRNMHDIHYINNILFVYDQELLGTQ